MKTEVGERIIKILDSFAIYCGLADNHENADIISYICNKKAFIEVPIPGTFPVDRCWGGERARRV